MSTDIHQPLSLNTGTARTWHYSYIHERISPGDRNCVSALRSCVFQRAMLAGYCTNGLTPSRLSCGRGLGESPRFFLTFAHAKTLFGNSVDLLVEFLSIIS